MKKAITVLALLFVSTLTFAGKPLKVSSGSLDFLKEGAVAKLEMDYSNTTWERKKSYEVFCEDAYNDRVEQSAVAVMTGFNNASRQLKITDSQEDAKYTITVHVADLERKMWDIAELYIRVVGTITVVDNETGEEVCVIEIDKLKGNASYVPDARLFSCFQTLGMKLAKLD